jgi:allophanate hydrolase
MKWSGTLAIPDLLRLYRSRELRPRDVIDHVYARIAQRGDDHVWISVVSKGEALDRADALDAGPRDSPLYGIPFAVKDLFDVSGLPTTAGCPAYSYVAGRTATLVGKLVEAGAILIGKTNLDQFATGLVGVRSPYGIALNPFDARYIPGGSSSGSAVAVSSGLVSFALGTDTAGSGRVPAAFANIVGMKPTRGLLSSRGMVPACRTLDCASVFALTCDDASTVMGVAAGFDPEDPFSRREAQTTSFEVEPPDTFRFGVPRMEDLRFFGDSETPLLFARAVQDLEQLGGTAVTVDFTPFREAAELLYHGPWVAERLAGLKDFFARNAEAVHPITREIIAGATRYSAVDAFLAFYHLADLKRRVEPVWESVNVLVVPTAGRIYTIAEVEADPVALNTNLGYYTNFVNLLDCCAVASPHSFTSSGLPFGVTLIAPAGHDASTLAIAGRLHRSLGLRLGATDSVTPVAPSRAGFVPLVVAGAHLRGQPLNGQLRDLGARFVRQCRTAPCYRLYALGGGTSPRAGLVRVLEGGAAIEVEVWELSLDALGRFVLLVPPPLAIGSVQLDSAETINGFVCEPVAIADAKDITRFGGWRNYQRGGAEAPAAR